jgi:hypothetical protein
VRFAHYFWSFLNLCGAAGQTPEAAPEPAFAAGVCGAGPKEVYSCVLALTAAGNAVRDPTMTKADNSVPIDTLPEIAGSLLMR